MQNKKISLVIPVYNEEKIIGETVKAALSFMEENFSDFELIISDDGSTDKTAQLVKAIHDPRLKLVGYEKNRGKGAAVRHGVLSASGDYIVYTDADLAYGIEAVGEIVKALEEGGADVALGSRKLHEKGYGEYPLLRLAASRSFSLIAGLFMGFCYDTQCGIKAFKAGQAKKVFEICETEGFAFDFEIIMLSRAFGFSFTELPVMIVNHRESKVRVLRDSLKMFYDVIRIRVSVKKRLKKGE
ncbi:MAG: glycosyltransferase [Clostridiales bacterium]|nr:glycosyltransferase [Clostridiales bacterium]